MNSSAAERAPGAELQLSDAQFDRIRELVREHTGIALSDAKRQLVYGRLARRLRALEMAGFDDYIALLERDDGAEVEEFSNAITTNLTSFFREPYHFEYLADHALPVIARRAGAGGRVRLWCCAASTGEEPWTLAIVLREQARLLAGMDVKLLATDIDSNVLASAAVGVYDAERVQGMAPERIGKWFERGVGASAGKVRVREELRTLVTYKRFNLMHEFPMRGPFDAIFCRNVIIYFDKPTQRELFKRMATLQRPGDFLFLGHSESLYRVSDEYELVGRTIYRKL